MRARSSHQQFRDAPGHPGELTEVLDFNLVDAAAEKTGTIQRRTRLLPTRVGIDFVLALALFEHGDHRRVWAKLVADGGRWSMSAVLPPDTEATAGLTALTAQATALAGS